MEQMSLGALFSGIINDAQRLIKNEIALARAETGENLRRTRRKIVYFTVGALILWQAITFGLLGAVFALTTVWAPHWAALAVAGGLLLAGVIAIAAGYAISQSVVPERTIETIKEDVKWIRGRAA